MTTTRLIGTYADPATARAVQAEVADIVGEGAVRMGTPADVRDAKIAEDQAQSATAGPFPATPPMTGSTAKASIGGAALGAVVGALLILPLGFVAFGDMGLGPRLLAAAVIGAAGGSVVGWLSGGYLGGHVATKPLAADRGTVICLEVEDPQALQVMVDNGPIRLDRVAPDGSLVAKVADEDDGTLYARRLGTALVGHDDPDEMVPGSPTTASPHEGR